jgi:hypothetical protein
MMTRPGRTADRSKAGGFVLVGVAMFILVLTILALSLFSLSSYESQFFERSYRDSRAFYEAAGGLERARWVLVKSDSLARVGEFLPPGTEAHAYQDKGGGFVDSLGRVNYDNPPVNDVLVRVTTTNRDIRETVEARFVPTQSSDYYKRLMTLSGRHSAAPDTGLWVYKDDGVGDTRWSQTALVGKAWQNPPPGPPCDQFVGSGPPGLFTGLFNWMPAGGVPDPDVTDYLYGPNGHWAGAQLQLFDPSMIYTLNGSGWPSGVGFFKAPAGGGVQSLLIPAKAAPTDPDVQINVQGTVVWMFDAGLLSHRRVQVHGSGALTDLLVLVALPTNSGVHRKTGLGFFMGLESLTVPVIMVTSGYVKLMHVEPLGTVPSFENSSAVNYLSIYAQSVELMGPALAIPLHVMALTHAPSAAPDLLGGAVDRLYQLGWLPNFDASGIHDLPMRPGTWHQVAQNN